MLDYCLWQWMKEEPTIGTFVVPLDATYRLAVPADPMRFAFTVPNGFSSSLMLILGDTPTASTWMTLQSSGDIAVFTWEMIGGAVQFPLWARLSASSTGLQFQTYSWNPQRYNVYRRVLNEQLSKYGAS